MLRFHRLGFETTCAAHAETGRLTCYATGCLLRLEVDGSHVYMIHMVTMKFLYTVSELEHLQAATLGKILNLYHKQKP